MLIEKIRLNFSHLLKLMHVDNRSDTHLHLHITRNKNFLSHRNGNRFDFLWEKVRPLRSHVNKLTQQSCNLICSWFGPFQSFRAKLFFGVGLLTVLACVKLMISMRNFNSFSNEKKNRFNLLPLRCLNAWKEYAKNKRQKCTKKENC